MVQKFLVDTNSYGLSQYYLMNENESEKEFIERVEKENKKGIAMYKSYIERYPGQKNYWNNRLNEELNRNYVLMDEDEFHKCEKDFYLNMPIKETTKEEFHEQLNVLPPLYWHTNNDVNEFCMSEMYSYPYTSQYAHDRKTNKYYCKIVDVTDEDTWISNLLER